MSKCALHAEDIALESSTFLLLHGAWHDARCWRLLVPLLQAAGHRVLTPDLPGHGSSTLPPARATLKAYVEAIVAQLQHIDSRVILVGHSMAGMVITQVAAQLPQNIARLVYLCAYLPQPGDSVFALIARNRGHEPFAAIELALEMSADKRTCTLNPATITSLFYTDAPPVLAQQAATEFALQGSLPLAAPVHYDPQMLATVPRSYICCTRDRVIPLHHQRRMLAADDTIAIVELASDHSPFYCCPDQLAALLTACTA